MSTAPHTEEPTLPSAPPGGRQWLPGETLGRYKVLERLGRGSMGEVVRAYDARLKREVALKILHLPDDADARANTVREARAMAQLSHPNVVHVFDVQEEGGALFIAMELVVGQPLSRWLAGAKRSWSEVVDVFVLAARGLAAAHAEGIVHRDFKPANVLVSDEGRVLVADFGIARALAAGDTDVGDAPSALPSASHEDSEIAGTPPYMAPEQHAGGTLDARTDQYAYCVALYEAIVGQRPFLGDDLPVLRHAKLHDSPRWPNTLPAWIGHVILRGLSVEPRDRWPAMHEVIVELTPPRPRWPRALWLGGGVVLMSVAALSITFGRPDCEAIRRSNASLWDDARAQAVLAGLDPEARVAQDVVVAMRDWADAWARERLAACEGSGGLPIAVEHKRIACLERAAARFGAMAERFADADPQARARAHLAVAGLPAPSACSDVQLLAAQPESPTDLESATEADAILRALEHARGLLSVGATAQAQQELDALLQRAQALHHAPVIGVAQWLVGYAELEAGRTPQAVASMHEAFATLTAARAHRDAAKVAASLALATATQGDRGAAEVWATAARAGFDTYGSTEFERAALDAAVPK